MNSTIDDADSPVVYSSSPAWNTGIWSQQTPQPLFATNHGTPNPGAYVTLTFSGTGVYVYGFKASDHGYRDVSIDGRIPVRCDGRNGEQGSRALVYWAEGLSPGQHNITLQHTGNLGQYLNIDYFVHLKYYPQASSPIGLISGIAAGVVALSLVAAIWTFWLWRRKVQQQSAKDSNEVADEDWKPLSIIEAGVLNSGIHTIQPFYTIPANSAGQPSPSGRSDQQRFELRPISNKMMSLQSAQIPGPSVLSPPPTQTRFGSLSTASSPQLTSSPGMTTTFITNSSIRSDAAEVFSDSPDTLTPTTQRRGKSIGYSKTRHSGTDSHNTPQPSHPMPTIIVEHSVPPPRYEQ